MTDSLLLVVGLLADDAPRDTGPDFGKASPFGLLVVVVLLIATFFLVRSMNRHLKKLPESFDDADGASSADGDSGIPEPPADDRPPREPGG